MVNDRDRALLQSVQNMLIQARDLNTRAATLLDGMLTQAVPPQEKPPESIPLAKPAAESGPTAIGYRWMEGLFGFNIQPVSSMLNEYRWIGMQPEADRKKVAESIQNDEWIRTHRGLCTARHVVRHWGRYLMPPAAPYQPPKDFKVQRDEARAESAQRALADFDAETKLYLELAKNELERASRAERRAVTRMTLERKL